jgi:hypothetical protein
MNRRGFLKFFGAVAVLAKVAPLTFGKKTEPALAIQHGPGGHVWTATDYNGGGEWKLPETNGFVPISKHDTLESGAVYAPFIPLHVSAYNESWLNEFDLETFLSLWG